MDGGNGSARYLQLLYYISHTVRSSVIGRYTQIRLLQWVLQCPRCPDYVATNMSEQLHELGTYEYDIMSVHICSLRSKSLVYKYKCSQVPWPFLHVDAL
jgi:hypothetical protein